MTSRGSTCPSIRAVARASALVALCALGTAPAAQALDKVNTRQLRNAVTVNGVLKHERALQQIANANGGTRASGTPGYEASIQYVKGQLQKAGYSVSEQEFQFPFFRDLAAPTLSQVSPTPTDYETATYQFSGTGDVTGTVVPALNNQSPPGPDPSSSSAGCAAADFTPASATEPQVALIQRGTCTFAEKAANAQAAGYDAVIIYNEGQEGRTDLSTGTLGEIFTLPVVGLSFADGDALNAAAAAGSVTVHVTTATENDPNAVTKNLIADTKSGDKDQVVVVGSHLDSVTEGPGINDNGSGLGHDLEVAIQMAKLQHQAASTRPVRVLGRGGVRPARLAALRRQPWPTELAADRREPELRHARLAELRPLRLRRRRLRHPGPPGRAGSGADREGVQRLLRIAEPRDRADRVRRPLGLRAVHRRGRPGRRAVLGRGGHQDRGGGGDLRRHRRCAVRRLLPPGMRHGHQPQLDGAERDVGRRRPRDADARPVAQRLLRGRQPHEGQRRAAARDRGPA